MTNYTQWKSLVDLHEYSAIPDGLGLQYSATTWSENDSEWQDDTDTSNMSNMSSFSEATLSDGSDAIEGDGVDDHGLIPLPDDFEGDSLKEFAIEFCVQYDDDTGSAWHVLGFSDEDSGQWIQATLNQDNFDDSAGNLTFRLEDTNGNVLQASPESNPNLDDGQRHDVSIIVSDSTNSNMSIVIDGNDQNLNFNDQGDPFEFTVWSDDLPTWARRRPDIEQNAPIKIGAFRFWTEDPSEQTINEYPGEGGLL